MSAGPRRRRLTGRLRVALPPAEAFRLFTPYGERDWVEGWEPLFPEAAEDDTAPGTVFQTHADGANTTWIVLRREPGRSVSYARVREGAHAGTVGVTLAPVPQGHSDVTVTYDLTPLTAAAEAELAGFAAGYPAFLRSWEDAIAAHLARAAGALPGDGASGESGRRRD
ncbi:SRPBCC family protein [Microbispora sp. H10836]|uniref:SRPBCC family protein n=1 Tax=Microbispora sp. H10836 TaxID=2729106 RepID=UPI001B8ABE42|nr:SRPBCC family protein [Microbispora sp. H10836]